MDPRASNRPLLLQRIFGDVRVSPPRDTLAAFLAYLLILGALCLAFQVFTTAHTAANFIVRQPGART